MSGTTNPNIILGVRPNAVSGPDFGAMVADSQQLLQFRQQQDQVQRQNALLGIFKDPNSLDQTGNPTPETLQKVMSVDPNAGMQLRQNMLIGQQTKLRTEALSSDLMAKKMEMIGEAAAPVLEHYKEQVAAGVPEEQARREAQSLLINANERLKGSGVFVEDDYKRFPTQFDPIQMEQVVSGTKQYQDWLKQRRDEEKQKATEKHYADVEYNKGTSLTKDNQGNPVVYRPNAPPGEQFKYQDGSSVPQERLKDLTKVTGAPTSAKSQENQRIAEGARFAYEKELGRPVDPNNPDEMAEVMRRQQAAIDKHAADQAANIAGAKSGVGGSVSVQDRRDQEFIIKNKYEAEIGHPVETDAEKAELKSRLLAAEDKRRADAAGAAAGSRQAATAAPKDYLVNGKPQQLIWKNGHYFQPDGTQLPANAEVRSNSKPVTPGQAAERDAMIVADGRIREAEEKAGAPLSEEAKAEIRRSARSDPKVQEAIRKSEGTAISDDAARIIAEETIQGDFHGTVGMGRNQASMRKIADMRGQIAKERGLTGADLAANTAEFNGIIAAERVLGTRGAGIDLGISEAKKFAPMVLAASERIDRTRYPTVNALQLAMQKGTGGEDVIRLIDAMNAYKMAYTQILTRGGMPTDDARRRSDEIIDKAWSNGQIRTAIDQLGLEMNAAQSAVPAVRDNLYRAITGKTRNTEPAQSGQPASAQTGQIQIPPALADANKAGKLAHNADGTVFYNTETKKYYDNTGKETAAPGAAQPAQTAPAQQRRPVQSAPQPMPTKAEDAVDGQVYNTARGPARWDAKTKQFFPVQAQ